MGADPPKTTKPGCVHVLWWRYSDGSGMEIIRAYLNADRADQDWFLVKDCQDRKYHLSQVPLLGAQNVE